MGNLNFSQLANTLISSEIVKLGATIKEKIRNGEHIYNYTIGDFDSAEFPIPAELKNEIIRAYTEDFTTYPAAEGELDLRLAVSEFISAYEGIDYSRPRSSFPMAGAVDLCRFPQHRRRGRQGHFTLFRAGITIITFISPPGSIFRSKQPLTIISCQRHHRSPSYQGCDPAGPLFAAKPTGTVFSKEEL